MSSVILQPGDGLGEDVCLVSTSPNTNQIGRLWVAMGEHNALTGYYYRMVIRFDGLTNGQVPKNRRISSAILGLYLYNDTCNYSRSYSFFRLKQSYVPNQVTWNSRATGVAWNKPGLYTAYESQDYEKPAIATTTLAASEADGFKYWEMDPDLIFEMVNGRYPNYGFFGICDAEYNDAYDFRSSRVATAGNRPKLTLEIEDYSSDAVML